jgi:mono/diheme cytochrome c family protein
VITIKLRIGLRPKTSCEKNIMALNTFRWIIPGALAVAIAVTVTACDREQPAAPAATAPPPTAAAPATPARARPQTAPDTSDLLARGTYLMQGIVACGNCHSPRDANGEFIPGMELAGGFVIEEPIFRAYAPNITPDVETGIGSWTDEEIVRAVREGVRPDGSVMGPPMAFPFYRDISDLDMQAIVAYMRNVPAVRNEVPDSTFNIPLPPNWGPPVESVPHPSRANVVAYGEYLAHTLGHCTDCHTPLVDGAHDFSRIGAGGNVFPQPFGMPWAALAPNITQHPDLGLGNWTDEEIKLAITDGISRDGRTLLPFMGFDFYANIAEDDLDAIIAYLRTLPPSEATPVVH